MTVHKSKGLEFDAVFIPKLENGEFPVRERGGRKYWHVLGEDLRRGKTDIPVILKMNESFFTLG